MFSDSGVNYWWPKLGFINEYFWKMAERKNIGDLFVLADGHKTMIIEVNENGWPIKLRSLEPDPQLGKIGWFQEGEDWVVFQYSIFGGDASN